MRKVFALFALYWLSLVAVAFAQSSPNWSFGYVPSQGEWNLWWSKKADVLPGGLLACTSLPTLVGDTTTTPGTCVTAVNRIQGTTITSVPSSGILVGASDTQTLSNKSISATEVNSGVLAVARIPSLPASQITSGILPFAQGGTNDAGTAWTPWGTTLQCSSGVIGSFTLGTGAATSYKLLGKTLFFTVSYTINNQGTCGGFIELTLPNIFTPAATQIITGREISVNGSALTGTLNPSFGPGNLITVVTATNACPCLANWQVVLTGVIQIQ